MTYEVRGDGMWRVVSVFGSDDGVEYAGTVDEAVTDALDVLRAAWGPDAVTTEYQDSAGLVYRDLVAEDREGERTVVRSPWREVEQ